MSFKAKNLTVNNEEPTFLKRLRGEVGESTDRHSQPIGRPRKGRQAGDDDDDAPAYVVDEATNETMSKAEVEQLKEKPTAEGSPNKKDEMPLRSGAGEQSKTNKIEKVGQIGTAMKRRIAKVVGETGDEEGGTAVIETAQKPKTSIKKKAKMKLSFEED